MKNYLYFTLISVCSSAIFSSISCHFTNFFYFVTEDKNLSVSLLLSVFALFSTFLINLALYFIAKTKDKPEKDFYWRYVYEYLSGWLMEYRNRLIIITAYSLCFFLISFFFFNIAGLIISVTCRFWGGGDFLNSIIILTLLYLILLIFSSIALPLIISFNAFRQNKLNKQHNI